MTRFTRRQAISSAVAGAVALIGSHGHADEPSDLEEKRAYLQRANEQWSGIFTAELAEMRKAEAQGHYASLEPPQELLPFKDWDFYYVKGRPLRWVPNKGQSFSEVVVPPGFVTDLASVPSFFWSSGLRPEGAYAYAAIVHDYLYWTQLRSRQESDDIFLFAMEDSEVDSGQAKRLHFAVRKFGSRAWEKNAKLKTLGEKRVLKRFPEHFTVSWSDFKRRPDVFAD